MRVRALDSNGDWIFGVGLNAYLTATNAVAQCIQTACSTFLGECFFAINVGIDRSLFGSRGAEGQLELAFYAIISQVPNVTGVNQVSVSLGSNREINVEWDVQTAFSTSGLQGSFSLDLAG